MILIYNFAWYFYLCLKTRYTRQLFVFPQKLYTCTILNFDEGNFFVLNLLSLS
jgi:hypothetical protein